MVTAHVHIHDVLVACVMFVWCVCVCACVVCCVHVCCVCACVYVVCVCPVNPQVQELVQVHELLVGQRVDQERGQVLGHGDNPEPDS